MLTTPSHFSHRKTVVSLSSFGQALEPIFCRSCPKRQRLLDRGNARKVPVADVRLPPPMASKAWTRRAPRPPLTAVASTQHHLWACLTNTCSVLFILGLFLFILLYSPIFMLDSIDSIYIFFLLVNDFFFVLYKYTWQAKGGNKDYIFAANLSLMLFDCWLREAPGPTGRLLSVFSSPAREKERVRCIFSLFTRGQIGCDTCAADFESMQTEGCFRSVLPGLFLFFYFLHFHFFFF